MSKYREALFALNEADDCYQPETLEDLRKYFPTIREALTIICLDDLIAKTEQKSGES